jgi:hypothetical protein
MPDLPDAPLDELYRICLSFHSHTLSTESVIVCLEEQYLHDTAVIDFIAMCRKRLFSFIAERLRAIASRLEKGLSVAEEEVQFRTEIYTESFRMIDLLKQRIDDDYLDLLLKAYCMDNYSRFLRTAPRKKERSIPGKAAYRKREPA